MSKIESGKMKLVKDDFQLDKMIGELYPLLEAKFEEKSQKYHQEIIWSTSGSMGMLCVLSQVPDQSVKQRSEIFRGSHGDHFNSRGNKAF